MSADETRNRLLETAGPIFAAKGFQAATVRDICNAAQMNVASVNYYFGDKERLYIETVKRASQMRAEEEPMPQWSQETPPAERLRGFIRTLTARMVALQEAPWQVQLMMREVLQPTSACKELVQEYFRPHFNLLLGILDEILPDDTPQHRRHQIGFSIVGQIVHYRLAGDVVGMLVGEDELKEHFTIEQLAKHVADFSLAALGLESSLGLGSSLGQPSKFDSQLEAGSTK